MGERPSRGRRLADHAGAFVVTAQPSVLSAGVMIALALVSSACTAAVALASGNLALAGRAVVRWATGVGRALVAGAVVLAGKQLLIHCRPTLN